MKNSETYLKKIDDTNISNYPFKHLLIENFLESNEIENLQKDLVQLERVSEPRRYVSDHGDKREWKSFSEDLKNLNGFLNFLASPEFIDCLKRTFSLPLETTIYPDPTYDGGGYVISPPGAFLRYHADFNYSSKAEKYRVINVLFYLNENYQDSFGGELHLLDAETKTVEKRVQPRSNVLLGFLTDDVSFHGVSIIREQSRRSFNIYYYADQPISDDQTLTPHKTIWVSDNEHEH